MKPSRLSLLAFILSQHWTAPAVLADGDGPAGRQQSAVERDKSSSNFKKTDQFLPGEEVITPTGKKMKVWSTQGPVAVSPPPEPFQDPSRTRDRDIDVVVGADGSVLRYDNRREPRRYDNTGEGHSPQYYHPRKPRVPR